MKRSKPKKNMSVEDRTLWKKVAQTTTPLSEKRGKFLEAEMARLMEQTAAPDTVTKTHQLPKAFTAPAEQKQHTSARAFHPSHPIEERVAQKLAKGRLPIDSRIDLHGMNQDRARFALLDFLQMAQRSDYRIVLVITGKGDEGRGVLRQSVPRWLALPAFKLLVNGFRESHRSHGGEGALYVRIRKLAATRAAK